MKTLKKILQYCIIIIIVAGCKAGYLPLTPVKIYNIEVVSSDLWVYSGSASGNWLITFFEKDSLANIGDTVQICEKWGKMRISKHDYYNIKW